MNKLILSTVIFVVVMGILVGAFSVTVEQNQGPPTDTTLSREEYLALQLEQWAKAGLGVGHPPSHTGRAENGDSLR